MAVTPVKKDKKEAEDVAAKKDAKTKDEENNEEKEVVKKDPLLLTLEDIREHCQLLERSVVRTESR